MNRADEQGRAWALLFARLVLGFIFFMAGVYKVFSLTPAGHVRKWFLPYRDTFLPEWSLWAPSRPLPAPAGTTSRFETGPCRTPRYGTRSSVVRSS